MEFLTFHVGEREFAVDLARVREIVTPPPITRVPGVPPALLGLVGLRGDPIAVVDAGLRLAARPVARSARTPLIVLSVREADRAVEIGLLVEAAGRKLELETLLPWTDGLARFAGSDACTGFADVDDRLVLVLDVDKLLSFGRIAAAGVNALPESGHSRPRSASGAVEPPRPESRPVDPSPQPIRQPLTTTPPSPPPPQPSGPAPVASARAISPEMQPRAAIAPAPSSVVSPPARPDAPLSPLRSAQAVAPVDVAHAPMHAHAPTHTHATERAPAAEPDVELELARGGRRRLGWIAVAAALVLGLLVLLLLTTDGKARSREVQPTQHARSAVVAPQTERSIERPFEPSREPPPPAPSEPPAAPTRIAVAARPPADAAPSAPAPVAVPTAAAATTPPARRARKLPAFMVVTPETPACEIHEVRRGDTLWAISARRLGDPYRWPQVFGENRDHLVDPDVIEVDDRIRIPGACNPAGVK